MRKVYCKINGQVTEKTVRPEEVSKYVRRGWALEMADDATDKPQASDGREAKPRRGRPKKVEADADQS